MRAIHISPILEAEKNASRHNVHLPNLYVTIRYARSCYQQVEHGCHDSFNGSAMENEQFVKEFGEHIENGKAALFIGAGLSRQAGYPSWKELLSDIATELG